MRRIFVGSSKPKVAIAKSISDILAKAGYEPVLWSKPDVFPAGSVTIRALMDMSEKCDGAVFVFGEDDELLLTPPAGDEGGRRFVARDNVILEYGLFVARLGPERTLIYKEGYKEGGVRKKSRVAGITDLSGITYVSDDDYRRKIPEAFTAAFDKLGGRSIGPRIVMHLSVDLMHKLAMGEIPNGWYSRAMYVGSKGAKVWADVEQSSNYASTAVMRPVAECIRGLCVKHKITKTSSVISFGPGVGLLDKAVLPSMIGTAPAKYIPIDLNDHLSVRAAETVDGMAHISIPFCIVADFEDEMGKNIRDMLRAYTASPRVFIMLGGTFNNLESNESNFLTNLLTCMDRDDTVILDVSVKTKHYLPNADPYMKLDAADPKNKATIAFLAAGVERRSKTPASQVEANFDQFVDTRDASFRSSIPDTTAFEFYSKTDNLPLINVKRFNFKSFQNFLKNVGFHIIAAECVGDATAQLQRGIVFLRKRLG